MIISMAVIVALTLVLFALVPRGKGADPAAVDVRPIATQVVAETGWPISTAQDLPEGWKATNARFTTLQHRRTWHAGYLTADREYISIDQTKGATDRWLAARTRDGARDGAVRIDGQEWRRHRSTDGDGRALVLPSGEQRPLTTVVWGTVSYDELVAFVGRLEPVRAGRG